MQVSDLDCAVNQLESKQMVGFKDICRPQRESFDAKSRCVCLFCFAVLYPHQDKIILLHSPELLSCCMSVSFDNVQLGDPQVRKRVYFFSVLQAYFFPFHSSFLSPCRHA